MNIDFTFTLSLYVVYSNIIFINDNQIYDRNLFYCTYHMDF